jgi:nicotinamidase-related amidase
MTDPYTRPLPDSAVLVLIDVQRDFYADDAPLPIEGTKAAIPAMASLVTEFRDRAMPIVHVVRLYRPDGSNADMVRKQAIEQGARYAIPGSTGSQIAPELLPNPVELDHELLLSGELQQIGPREHVMYKPRWGAFYQTKLEQHIRDTGSDTLVFVGCNFLSTRPPSATSGSCWCRMRCPGLTTEASRNVGRLASTFETSRRQLRG